MALSIEKKVGIFFILALVALGVMIEAVENWNPFETRIAYHTHFDSVVGIKAGDPVRLAGVEVGKVESISLEEERVRVDFYVVEGTRVRAGSVARIRQTNLLGGQFLGLDFGSGEALPPGSALPSEPGANIDELITNLDRNQERVLGALGDLIADARGPLTDTMARFESIAAKIDEGEGVIGKMVNDPHLYDEIRAAVGGLAVVIARIEAGEGTMGRLFNDTALYDEALGTLANLQTITGSVRDGEGTVGRLLTDDALYAEALVTLQQIREIVGRIAEGEGSLARLLNDAALYEEATEAMARIASIAAKIDDGQGTMGRLVNDDALYRDAKTTLHKVEKTVDGLSDSGPLSALGVVLGTLF